MKHRNRGVLFAMVCILGMGMGGCAMRGGHFKSLIDVRNVAAENYSQQVVEAIAGVTDRSELPILFTVEGGNSVWNPKYEGTFGVSVNPPWGADRTSLSPGILGSETRVDTFQYNDFGSAATYRINLLYTFLCFPYAIEDLQLPHGMLHSIVDIRDSKEDMEYAVKLKNGKYLGVPPEKTKSFLLFTNDAVNWSRHATPNILDLSSPPGIAYIFLYQYYDDLISLYKAIEPQAKLKQQIEQDEKDLGALVTEYYSQRKKALASTGGSDMFTTALRLMDSEIQLRQQGVSDEKSQLKRLESEAQKYSGQCRFIVGKLERALTELAEYDPDVSEEQVNKTITTLRTRIDRVEELASKAVTTDQNDVAKLLEEIKAFLPVGGSGIDADESSEDLYRERFEKLPDTIDSSVIRLN